MQYWLRGESGCQTPLAAAYIPENKRIGQMKSLSVVGEQAGGPNTHYMFGRLSAKYGQLRCVLFLFLFLSFISVGSDFIM